MTRVWYKIITLKILLILLTGNIHSQNIPDAPFDDAPVDEMPLSGDQAVTPKEKTAKKIDTEYRLFTIGTFSYQPISDTGHLAVVNGMFSEKTFSALLNFDLNLKPRLKGNSSMVFRTDIEAVVSTLYGEDTLLFDKNFGDYVRLDELFMEVTPFSQMSFLVGKYRHIFSPGLFQNPMDRHNPVSTLPGEPAAREGAWMSMLSFDTEMVSELLSRLRISLAFLPGFFQYTDGLPAPERDIRVIDSTSPAGFKTVTESYDSSYAGGFARLYLNLFKGDFNLMYYYTEKQHQGGFSYSRYFLNAVEWHGEILFYEKPHSQFGLPDNTVDFYTDALTGFRLDMGSDLSFVLEYLYRQDSPRNYPSNFADQQRIWLGLLGTDSNSHALTPMRNYLILTMMLTEIKDILDVSFNIVANPFDEEALFTLRTDFKVDKASKLSFAGVFKTGSGSTFYGSYLPFDYQVRVEYYIALL
jgi:hypothetical protein